MPKGHVFINVITKIINQGGTLEAIAAAIKQLIYNPVINGLLMDDDDEVLIEPDPNLDPDPKNPVCPMVVSVVCAADEEPGNYSDVPGCGRYIYSCKKRSGPPISCAVSPEMMLRYSACGISQASIALMKQCSPMTDSDDMKKMRTPECAGGGMPGSVNWANHTWTFKSGTQYSSILSRTDSAYLDFIAQKDKETRAGYFAGWEDGAGDQSQWQKFGIPKVSATQTSVTPTYPFEGYTLEGYRGGLYRLGGVWEACMNRLGNAPDRSIVQDDLRANRMPSWERLSSKGQTDTAACEREAGYTSGYEPWGPYPDMGSGSCPSSVLSLLGNDRSCHRMDFSFTDVMANTWSGAYMTSGMAGPYVLIQKSGSPDTALKNCNVAGERITMCTGSVTKPDPSAFNNDPDKCWNNGYKYNTTAKTCSYSSTAPPPVDTLHGRFGPRRRSSRPPSGPSS